MNPERTSRYALALTSSAGELERLYRFLQQSLRGDEEAYTVNKEVVDDLKLVAEEWFSNVVYHGYGADPQGHIEIELEIDDDTIRINFRDSAETYNPIDTRDDRTRRDFSTGGMGMTIIKSLTDSQSYERIGRQNVFTVTKHYNPE